jgi:catechol 2,3-dioxygenase-like lactoylglutathione lyase family enzyme
MPNEFDPDSAAEELARTEAMGSDAHRRAVARISTAALIDIAASLKILAAEVVFSGVLDPADIEPTVDVPITESTRDFLVKGDIVRVIGGDAEPGEVVGLGFDQGEAYANVEFAGGQERYYVRNLERLHEAPEPGEVVGLGFDQGEAYANVEFAGGQERYYVRNLERLHEAPEPDDEMPTFLVEKTPAGVTIEELGEPEPPAVADVEDLDDDFDGDHFTAADEALERLRANEAERKAEKKKGSKK